MQTSTFSYTRQNLTTIMDKIVDDHIPITITRQNKKSVVMISLEDFRSMEETAYLMQSLNNAQRLNSAIAELEAGLGTNKQLIEE